MTDPDATAQPGSGSTRARNRRGQGALLRSAILDSAQQLLEREGTEAALTIRAVTREAGIAPQSFYLHFSSMSDLLWAIYGEGQQKLYATLAESVDASSDARHRISAIASAYLRFSRESPGVYRTLMGVAGKPHPEWSRLPGSATFELLQDAVAQARTDLSGRPDDLHIATTLLWTQLHGVASLMISRPAFAWPPEEQLVDSLCAHVVGIDLTL